MIKELPYDKESGVKFQYLRQLSEFEFKEVIVNKTISVNFRTTTSAPDLVGSVS